MGLPGVEPGCLDGARRVAPWVAWCRRSSGGRTPGLRPRREVLALRWGDLDLVRTGDYMVTRQLRKGIEGNRLKGGGDGGGAVPIDGRPCSPPSRRSRRSVRPGRLRPANGDPVRRRLPSKHNVYRNVQRRPTSWKTLLALLTLRHTFRHPRSSLGVNPWRLQAWPGALRRIARDHALRPPRRGPPPTHTRLTSSPPVRAIADPDETRASDVLKRPFTPNPMAKRRGNQTGPIAVPASNERIS
jgi:hypothetical protein